jgi:prepilin-type N-terminal cleavage/methylation domain-containing protein
VGTSKGFSLLELLIVIAIVAILGAVAATSLTNYRRQLNLSEAKQLVVNAIRRSSDDAIRQTRTLTLTVENSSQRLVWSEGTIEIGRQDLPSGATVGMVRQDTTRAAQFTGRGIPTQQLTFTVTRGGLSQTFTLLVTGLVAQP